MGHAQTVNANAVCHTVVKSKVKFQEPGQEEAEQKETGDGTGDGTEVDDGEEDDYESDIQSDGDQLDESTEVPKTIASKGSKPAASKKRRKMTTKEIMEGADEVCTLDLDE
jgi:hypothetical protein